MKLCRVEFPIIVAAVLLLGTAGTALTQPGSPSATPDDGGYHDLQRNGPRDPFDGVVSRNLYDNMAAGSLARRSSGVTRAGVENRPLAAWARLRRHSTAYRGAADPFAEPSDNRPAAPYREPATRASRRPGQGDAGWFGGTARGAGTQRPLQPRQQIGPMGSQGATGPLPMQSITPGQVLPLRTMPDPTSQPPGRGAFGYGRRPGSGGPFGFDRNVITGGDQSPAGQTP